MQRQLFNELGQPIEGQGASKNETYAQGLLHGASHVWIWHQRDYGPEILLQKRAPAKRTWPGRYDISAAGHIDLGEDPIQAALRETKEELGISIAASELRFIGVHYDYMVAEDGAIENEFQWLYLLQLLHVPDFSLRRAEVTGLLWKSLPELMLELEHAAERFVPHDILYYRYIMTAIERLSSMQH